MAVVSRVLPCSWRPIAGRRHHHIAVVGEKSMSEKKLPPEFEHAAQAESSDKRSLTRRDFVKIAGAGTAAITGGLIPKFASAAPKPPYSTPTITCDGSTAASINIKVCAGATGAPAGFTIQWETLTQYQNGPDGLPGTSDDNSWGAPEQCGGSFSGNANQSLYNLGPNECIVINIGDLLFDNGVSTNCPDPLVCNTTYIFRAFAHGDSTHNRSDFTGNLTCSTQACEQLGRGCTLTFGYWKTHGPDGCVTGNNSNSWPVSSLTLGTVAYTALELCSILNKPAAAMA